MCYKADIVVGGTMCEPKWHILKLVSVFLLGGCFHSRGVTNVHNYEVWWVRLLFSSEYINLHQGKSKKTPLEGTTTWNATWVWLKHSDTLMDKKNYINTANTASCVYSDKLGRIIIVSFLCDLTNKLLIHVTAVTHWVHYCLLYLTYDRKWITDTNNQIYHEHWPDNRSIQSPKQRFIKWIFFNQNKLNFPSSHLKKGFLRTELW